MSAKKDYVMATTPNQLHLVRQHGHRIERFIENGHRDRAVWYDTEYETVPGTEGKSLTESEKLALKAIKNTFDIDEVRRPSTGVDFLFGNVGFEVKSHSWWRLTEKQNELVKMLEAVIIVVATENGAYIQRVIR